MTIDELPRLLCARCGNIAVVHWIEQRPTTDDVLLWVECHKHALVLLSGERIQAELRPIELVDLQDVSSHAMHMFEHAEALMLRNAERASVLERFLRKAFI